MDELTSSPTQVKAQEHLSFYDALKSVAQGAKITKSEWEDTSTYFYMVNDVLTMRKAEVDYTLTVHINDMIGTDWIIL